jgi:3-oxoacyl-[acyl-carrier-protein] synthase-3
MSGKNAGLVSVGCYVPGKVVDPRKKAKLVEFLRGTLLPPEYIKEIEETGKMPGYVETNYDGWESQPWFEE